MHFDNPVVNRTIDYDRSDLSDKSLNLDRGLKQNKTLRQHSVIKYKIGKRSGSTYGETFDDSPEKRSKSKVLNTKVDFRFEEISNSCKFPPIPKSKIGEEYVKKNPIQARVKDLGYLQRLSPEFKRSNLNKTVIENAISLQEELQTLKHKKSSKEGANQSIENGAPRVFGILNKDYANMNVAALLKPNLDRPKISLLQDTLQGVIPSNPEFKQGQRKLQKFKHWAGIKIPVNSELAFNKRRDKINHWDECRDGIFNKL